MVQQCVVAELNRITFTTSRRDVVRAMSKHDATLLNAKDKKDRKVWLKSAISGLDGRIALITEMQEVFAKAPTVPVPGKPGMDVDLRWNVGLPPPEISELERRRSLLPSRASLSPSPPLEHDVGLICAFCATLSPPVKAQHRLLECAKRKKANVREFLLSPLQEADAALQGILGESREFMAKQMQLMVDRPEVNKYAMLELAGAIKVLGKLDERVPLPPAPPLPPKSVRRQEWLVYDRQKLHTIQHIVRIMSRELHLEKNASWGQLKAAALMTPLARVLEKPLDPEWLLHTANDFGVDLGPDSDERPPSRDPNPC